ncbi:glycosyltransferase family 4 protein [Bacillus mycoides]|uniref:glycosyltransferase family 4 protein n=1 Tax=Bacillus mycoides TaxID=1405 RepID=UPI001A359635|nr:glycosyltransferase family 4 protein [Bacillus mycoides]MBJ7996866.1 glycosyltransferase family 4 protein [Bacillus cereus]QWH82901.1 glycosyltransferase family 4 protein [Bacillus mycoides]QWI95296.1 glycosyltransferase family 4 protein [Bacillus mycoides]UNJ95675.1 glycosyltransferase family 4 protein [Bacillus mycoides]
MKVLILCCGAWVEVWNSYLKGVADLDGVQLTVATTTPSDKGLNRLEEIKQRNVNVKIYKGMAEKLTGHAATAIFPSEIKELFKQKPDIIHIIGEAGYISTWQAIKLKKSYCPEARLTIRAAQNVYHKYIFPFSLIEKFSYKNVNHICPVSTQAIDVLREKGYEGEVTVIPNGFDKEVFSPQLDVELKTKLGLASFVIGYVGNFTLQKGIYNLIEAFAKIKHKNTKLFMIGRGPEKENLIERIKQLGIEDRVVIIDYVEQLKLPIYMSCMDVLVLPSKQMKYAGSKLAKFLPFLQIPWAEQFGRVLVEGMACKIPIIGSSSGSIPDVVSDVGLIFEENNSDDLAVKLDYMIENEDFRNQCVENGYIKAYEKYTWDKVAENYHRVWNEK